MGSKRIRLNDKIACFFHHVNKGLVKKGVVSYMLKRRNFGIFIFSLFVIASLLIFFGLAEKSTDEKTAYDIQRERQDVLNELFATFETKGSSIEVGDSSHIFINVENEADIPKVRKYLSENLSYEYVKDFEIDVFSFP